MNLLKQSRFKLQDQQNGDAADAGGGQAPKITPEVQALIDSHISGLKTKNGELIAAQKQLKEQLATFDGINPDIVRNIIKRFADDEEAKLISEGKIDDVLNKRTERMKVEHDKQIKEREDRITKSEAKAQKLAARTLAGAIRDAAIKEGALPEALDDIVLRGGSLWQLNEDGDVVAIRDGGVILGKDGKTALTPVEWAASLRETAQHLWPKAQGTNAPGSSSAAKGGKTISRGQFEQLAVIEQANYIKGGGRVA